MTRRVKISLTLALWLANGLFWLILIGLVAWRAQAVFLAGDAPALRLEPVTAAAWPALVLASAQARNPFDPAGTPWFAAGSAAPPGPAPGELRGIIVLPGVAVALTDHGAVKPGASLDKGRLLSVKAAGAVVDTPSGRKTLTLPGSGGLTLQQLNQANKPKAATPLAPPAASNLGKS